MTTIWKFDVPLTDAFPIAMPAGAKLLNVAEQSPSGLFLWAEVDPSQPKVDRFFRIIGTGQEFVPDGLVYVGTAMQPPFVWHLYEMVPE